MEPVVDLSQLPAPVQRLIDPAGPGPLRQMAARGIAPGLKPGDALTVVALLAESTDAPIAELAQATLDKLPAPLLNGALAGPLQSGVLDCIAARYAKDAQVMEAILRHPAILPKTVATVASIGSEPVTELIATNEERLLAHPEIIEKLYMNRATRMSTSDRLIELAVRNGLVLKGIAAYEEAAAAIGGVLIAEPSEEPTYSDVLFREAIEAGDEASFDPATEDTHEIDPETGEEVVAKKHVVQAKKVSEMTISEKIRTAMLGSASMRNLLMRDTNRLVATAAIKSPQVQEPDVVRVSTSRNVHEDVLRIIATNGEWLKNHQIKFNLVENPRTPFVFAAKLLLHLRNDELKKLSRSKNVSNAVATLAKQHLAKKVNKAGGG